MATSPLELPLVSSNGFKSLKPFILKLLMCDLDWFSNIQMQHSVLEYAYTHSGFCNKQHFSNKFQLQLQFHQKFELVIFLIGYLFMIILVVVKKHFSYSYSFNYLSQFLLVLDLVIVKFYAVFSYNFSFNYRINFLLVIVLVPKSICFWLQF